MANQQKPNRQGRPQGNHNGEKPEPRYDKIRYDSYAFRRNGEVITKPATEAREVIRRLTCDKVVDLMIFDRQRTPAKTPKGRNFAIMAWKDKQQYAAWRYIAELTYGPLDKVWKMHKKWFGLGQHADTSVLTEFQIAGIRQIFLFVVASEMQTIQWKDRDGNDRTTHRSLATARLDEAVMPYAMVEEPDWFVEGIEKALERLEEGADQFLDDTVKLWLENDRARDLLSIKLKFKEARAAEVDEQVDTKEEEQRKLTESEIAEFVSNAKAANGLVSS